MAEFDLIQLIKERCSIPREDVRLGIGDDAALLSVPPGQLLAVGTDTLVAGVHFPHSTRSFDVGWKSLAVNLSDLAAMGATPAWASLALTLPKNDPDWVRGFADGFAALAREFKLALVGGDTTQGPLTISVTVHGFVPDDAAMLRDGARLGDAVFVTGTLGDARAGLRCVDKDDVEASRLLSAPPGTREFLIERLERPTPRVAQGLLLRSRATSCIDISDGLVADLSHICAASGVGADIEAERLPSSSALLTVFNDDMRRAYQLGGGDDYELCFTAVEAESAALLSDLARSGCAATRIGRIVADPGVHVRDGQGERVCIASGGWEHLR